MVQCSVLDVKGSILAPAVTLILKLLPLLVGGVCMSLNVQAKTDGSFNRGFCHQCVSAVWMGERKELVNSMIFFYQHFQKLTPITFVNGIT